MAEWLLSNWVSIFCFVLGLTLGIVRTEVERKALQKDADERHRLESILDGLEKRISSNPQLLNEDLIDTVRHQARDNSTLRNRISELKGQIGALRVKLQNAEDDITRAKNSVAAHNRRIQQRKNARAAR